VNSKQSAFSRRTCFLRGARGRGEKQVEEAGVKFDHLREPHLLFHCVYGLSLNDFNTSFQFLELGSHLDCHVLGQHARRSFDLED